MIDNLHHIAERVSGTGVGVGDILALITTTAPLVGVWLGAHISAKASLESTHKGVAFTRKAEAYASLAFFATRLRGAAQESMTQPSPALLALADGDQWWSWQAQAGVFGSRDVAERFEQLLSFRVELTSMAIAWSSVLQQPGQPSSADQEMLRHLRRTREEVVDACTGFIASLNGDLGIGAATAPKSGGA